jgi:hypothetical protein
VPGGVIDDRLGDLGLRNQSDRLGESESGTLALREEAGLAPGTQGLQTLFGLTGRPGILGVYVDAVGAAVDLRRPHLDQFEQHRIDTRAPDSPSLSACTVR